MNKGTLYGVGVGPGDPALLTLKAVEIIQRCPVTAAPRTGHGASVALDIVRRAMDLDGKIIVQADFSMSRDQDECARSHRAAALALLPHLDAGRDVAFLNLGDVGLYASFRYVADLLREENVRIEMIPGVASFSAAAARLGISLTDMDTPLHIIPDADDDGTSRRPGTTVWMKSGKRLPALLKKLADRGVLSRAAVVQNCGMENERVFLHPETDLIPDDYFTLVILKPTRERTP